MENDYSKRELDHFFGDVRADIKEIKEQVKFTNGKVRLHSKILLVLGAVVTTLLITSGNEKFLKLFDLFL